MGIFAAMIVLAAWMMPSDLREIGARCSSDLRSRTAS
jgi:hypothetical protein